jgi:hypothetical protein
MESVVRDTVWSHGLELCTRSAVYVVVPGFYNDSYLEISHENQNSILVLFVIVKTSCDGPRSEARILVEGLRGSNWCAKRQSEPKKSGLPTAST